MPFAHRLLAFLVAGLAAAAPAQAEPARVKAMVAEKTQALTTIQAGHIAELRAMAEIPAVRDYFLTPEKDRPAKLDAVEAALAGRQTGSELCLIDGHGSEHLRAVRGRLAPESELAKDEADAPFFQAGIRLAAGNVHVSEPYLSPDVEEWVVGYVVPVIPTQAILHYEHAAREMQAVATQNANLPNRFVLLVDPRGYVIADGRQPVALGMVGENADPKAYFRNIRDPKSGFPPELAAALAAGPKELKVNWNGKVWDVAWQHAHGLVVVGFDG